MKTWILVVKYERLTSVRIEEDNWHVDKMVEVVVSSGGFLGFRSDIDLLLELTLELLNEVGQHHQSVLWKISQSTKITIWYRFRE